MEELYSVEDYVNAGVFIRLEALERGIDLPKIEDKLREEEDKIVLEYPKPPERLKEEGEITLREVLAKLPQTFTIKDPPPQIYLVGRIVNEGRVTEEQDIDILVKQGYRDQRIINELNKYLPEEIKRRLHWTFTPIGPMVGKHIPIYSLSYTRTEEYQELTEEKIKIGIPFRIMKASTGFEKNEFFDEKTMWENWASDHIDGGIAIQMKADGISFGVHKQGEKIQIFTEDKLRDRAKYFPLSTRELRKIKRDFILMVEMVEFECDREIRGMEEKYPAKPREDMIPWVTAETLPEDKCIVFFIHDLLFLDDKDLHNQPYEERFELLEKLIPKDLIHWKIIPSINVYTKQEYERAVSKLRNINASEGVMAKDLQSLYKISYTTTPRTPDFAKLKNMKEIDVMVWNVHEVRAKEPPRKLLAYNYEVVIGNIPEEELAKINPKFIVEYKGKKYMILGQTYNTDIKAKRGDILTVSTIRIRRYVDEKTGKYHLTWMFPIVMEKRTDKKEPDPLDVALKIEKVGTKTLSEEEIRIPLRRCIYFDNPDVCPLYYLYSEEWREEERKRRDLLKIREEYLKFPIKCMLAYKFRCIYVKPYYYGYKTIEIEELDQYGM